jgi:hypothetical protein
MAATPDAERPTAFALWLQAAAEQPDPAARRCRYYDLLVKHGWRFGFGDGALALRPTTKRTVSSRKDA